MKLNDLINRISENLPASETDADSFEKDVAALCQQTRMLVADFAESKERADSYHKDWQKLRDENGKLKAAAAMPNVES